MGGVVALRLAVEEPEDVTALALVAPAGIVSTTRRAEIWLAVTAAIRPAQVMTRFRGTFARRPRLRWLPRSGARPILRRSSRMLSWAFSKALSAHRCR